MNLQSKSFETRFVFNVLVTLLLFNFLAFVPKAQDIVGLKLNVPIEREIKGSEAHSYYLALEANQFLRLVVDQRGIDIVATLFAPDGKKIAEVDSPNGTQGPEPITVITEAAGSYKLEVRSLEKTATSGKYEVRIEELRDIDATDKTRLVAKTKLAAADALRSKGTADALRQSLQAYQEALVLFKEINESRQTADALDGIARSHDSLGDSMSARVYFEQALLIWLSLGDRSNEANTYTAIGIQYDQLGEPQKALDYYFRALPINRALGETKREETTINNIGKAYTALGAHQKALDYLNQALTLTKPEDRFGRAVSLNNIAIIYDDSGDWTKALEIYLQSLREMQAIGNVFGQKVLLNNVGKVYYSMGNNQKALEFYLQARTFKKEIEDVGDIGIFANLGTVYNDLGEYEKALTNLNEALRLVRKSGNLAREAMILNALGRTYQSTNEKEKAVENLRQAIAFSREFKTPKTENAALYALAQVELSRNNLDEALSHIEAALVNAERMRSGIGSQKLRASYFATVQSYYNLGTQILMQMHQNRPTQNLDALALALHEKSRARGLLELLTEAHADIRQGVDTQLLERENSLQKLLVGKAARQTQVLSGKHTEEQAAAIAIEISDLTDQYEQMQAEIRQKSPRYATLTQPQAVSAKTIQTELLDKDTALLEYSLGKERSYMWFITPTEIKSFELPKEDVIEAQAQKVYQLLTARNEKTAYETTEQRRARVTKTDADYQSEAAKLSEMILAPAAAEIKTKRLLIVADGSLQYIPFAALPLSPKSKVKSPKTENGFLGETNEIVNLPSASVLAELRRDFAGRAPAPLSVAVFADPVFSFEDVRLNFSAVKKNRPSPDKLNETVASRDVDSKQGNQSATPTADKTNQTAAKTIAPDTDALRAFNETSVSRDGLQIPRLPFSRREATNILALTSEKQELAALDFKANLQMATSPELAKYRIVHFATHGILDNVHPELSGILLSLVDEKGASRDGFLRLNEIYNLKLPADLVVLSACQTALGKNVKGEGLIGLTRGFMYAGAPRVVASLWKVDDAATAELMRLFYQKMLKENARPAAALRAAKLEMSQNARWSAPYFWAAFTLQGEWK